MDRAGAAFISLLLMVSLFAPYGVMAQENDESEVVPISLEVNESTAGFCDIEAALDVVELDAQQAVALQGIVTQDVATSAEEYRKQASLDELGVDTRTERAKVADKYNFYFMGPDGTVFYYEVLDDLMRRDNGYLIGTDITGRIEYGGHLRENLALCGKSPSNVTTNVCSETGNVDKVNSYVEELKAASAASQAISLVTTLAPMQELTPSDVLNLGQSRMRMTEFTTSMATSGPGSSIFILPQALVMYTAAMKKLDMLDLVVAAISIGSLFKGQKVVRKAVNIKEKTGFFQRIKDIMRGSKSASYADDATNIKYMENAVHRGETLQSQVKTIQGMDQTDLKKLKSAMDTAFDQGDEFHRATKTLKDNGDEIAEALGDATGDTKAALDATVDHSKASLSEAHELYSKGDVDGALKKLYEIPEAKLVDTGYSPKGFIYKKYDTGALDVVSTLDEVPPGRVVIYDPNYVMEPADFTQLVGTKGAQSQDVATLFKPNRIKSFPSSELQSITKTYESATGTTRTVSEMKDFFRFSRKTESVTGSLAKSTTPGAARREFALAAKATVGAKLAKTFVAGIYLGKGTKAVMIARGLHYINDLFFRQGFFELTGAGLTLRYNKDEIGTIYRDDSVIVLLAQNSLVQGLLTAYMGGELGATLFGILGQVNDNVEPLVNKANLLGDVLVFGGIMYPPTSGVVQVISEQPQGTTHIEDMNGYYLMRIREWDDHVFSAVEDTKTMKETGGGLVTAMGMWTNKVDLYGHMYNDEDANLEGVFTKLDPIIGKLGSWGVFSNLLIASSASYMFFGPASMGTGAVSASIVGMPLGAFLTAKGGLLAGQEFMSAQYTNMNDLAQCVRGDNVTEEPETEGVMDSPIAEGVGEATGLSEGFKCERQACAPVLASCFAKEGTGSAVMTTTAALSYAAVGPGAVAIITAVDVIASIAKIKIRENCLADLATCQEHTFTIIGAAQYSDPVLIMEQQQSEQLSALPGLDDLPVKEFLDSSGLSNVTNPLEEFSQQQLNVHTEGYNASGRIAMDQVYYVHLQDVSIQWVEGNLPLNLCSLDDEGDPEEENCLKVIGENVMVGGKTIVTDELVPFKWMDTEMPALVIPNTAVTVDIPTAPGCRLFTVDKTGTRLQLNGDVIDTFEEKGFDEVTRLLGTLRVINTASGAIYPSVDYNGDYRFEHDKADGSYGYSENDVSVTANAKVNFEDDSFNFESAIFSGGSIVKKGNKIYILPKYFMPEMTGKQWLELTKGAPLRSDTGAPLEALDAEGNIVGIDASVARIPGGEKLGTLTRLDAWKDLNGDGEIQDEEKAGWRFYTDENNESKFELFYNGEKEVYDSDQIEVDEETGNIKVYEKNQPHTEANLLRDIETKVDSLGRTLLTIRDGEGNTLLEEALVTYLKGTGGAIRYDPDNNNYIFVNGQPVELNNDFKLNGFNPITGRTDPPLLQPSAVKSNLNDYEPPEHEPPKVPIRGDGFGVVFYVFAILAGIYIINRKT